MFKALTVNLYLVITFAVLLIESFSIDLPVFLDSRLFAAGLLIMLLILRLINMKLIKEALLDLNTIFLVILTPLSFALLYFQNNQGIPYFFRVMDISYSRVFYLTLASVAVFFYYASFNLTKKFYKKAIFIAPVYLALIGVFVYTRANPLFRVLVEEDHLVEYAQFFLLLGCTYLSFKISRYWWHKERILGILFLLAAILCFLVAGEEISWGQRLLGLETPETIAETNLQDEITLHNHERIFGYVYRGYMIIGLVGSTAWIFFRLLKNKLSKRLKTIFSNLIPGWYLSPYFAVAFFYNWDRFYIRPRTGETLWEEPMELLLIMGITIFFVVKFIRVHQPPFLNKFIQRKN